MTTKPIKKPPPRPSVTEKIEADLCYRLPPSGKPLSCIVLSREQAEMLLQEIYDLRQRVGEPQ